jgi:hypothetical protein
MKMKIRNHCHQTGWGPGIYPTGQYVNMFERKGRMDVYPKNNRDPCKEEIKNPPPHPHKRKNVNYCSHSKDPYFLCPPE